MTTTIPTTFIITNTIPFTQISPFHSSLNEKKQQKEKMLQGLIKDLVDVTLSSFNGEDDPNKSTSPSSREDHTRSSWAQVVSGDDREEGEYSDPRHHSSRPHHRKDEEYGRNEGLDADRQSHPPRRPQKVVSGDDWEQGEYSYPRHHSSHPHHRKDEEYGQNEGLDVDRQSHPPRKPQKEENDGRDEGWETVGQGRQQRRHQKVSMDHWNGYKRPPSEQEYSNEVDFGTDMEPSEEELADLSSACNRLWELDVNRLVPGKDYKIDCGEGKKAYQKEDMAQGSLFSWLSDGVFRRPTYSRFCSLLDNYNPSQGSKENVTSQERQEQAAFIEEISRTAPIKYLHKYLVSKRIVPKHYEDFKRVLADLWFELYGRGGTSGCSSAFEHVFVGEIKQRGEQEVSGFHNWIQFYLEEAKGRVDYQGYIFPRRRGQIPDSETQLLTVQFEWNGVLKSLSSTLIGVSPEFEVALYTLCFFFGEEDNHIQLGPYPVNIKCYRMGRDKIGSVFPIAEA